jgi:hypothetical protein
MQGAAVGVDEATATQLQQKISAFLMAAKSLDSYFATLGASCGADFSAGVLREVRGGILRLPHPGEVVVAGTGAGANARTLCVTPPQEIRLLKAEVQQKDALLSAHTRNLVRRALVQLAVVQPPCKNALCSCVFAQASWQQLFAELATEASAVAEDPSI